VTNNTIQFKICTITNVDYPISFVIRNKDGQQITSSDWLIINEVEDSNDKYTIYVTITLNLTDQNYQDSKGGEYTIFASCNNTHTDTLKFYIDNSYTPS